MAASSSDRLVRLYDATTALTDPALDEERLLRRIVEQAAGLTHARYAALGLLGPDGNLVRFETTGLTPDEYELLKDEPPHGRGILGALLREGKPLRLDDLGKDPRSVGFPPGHPPMRSFLGVPLHLAGEVIGRLYMTESERGAFSDEDEQLALGFAAAAGVALANLRLTGELRLSAGRLRSMVDALERGSCMTDADGRIILANERLALLLGLERDPLGLRERDFAHHFATPEVFLSALALEREQPMASSSEDFEMAGAPRRILRRYGAPVRDGDGVWLGRVAVYADVTQDRALQDQLVEAERLRATGEMASGLAHDFNNLLATILGRIEVVLGQVADQTVRENLDAARRAARDGAATVARMREYGRPLDVAEFQPVALDGVVREVVELTQPRWRDQAQREGRTIAVETPLEPTRPVLGDPVALREVLVNLIFNAVDAMPGGGRLTVGVAPTEGGAELIVRDTGVGMPAAVRRRVFEPFFTTKGDQGSGLGLAMVQKVVAAHGGRVEVTSTPGAGTVFTIWLPTTEATPQAPEAGLDETAAGPLRVARIVVVDDQKDVLDTTAMLLRNDGHDVRAFLDPTAAVASALADPPDLVLTDLGMPGMNGWDVARRVHAVHPAVPVVLLTGWGREIGRSQLREGGVAAVVPKPVDAAALRAALAAALPAEERPLRILLVDDSSAFAAVLAMLIGQAGHETTRVESGAAALDALGEGPYDLVLTDLRLPDRTASDVVAAARAAAGRPAVVVISGSAATEMEREAPGADLYVEKVRVADRLDDLVSVARKRHRAAL